VAVFSPVDDTRTTFADIVCTDAEWVRTEFEQIVSGLVIVSTATSLLPHLPDRPGPGFGRVVSPVDRVGRRGTEALVERVRAPPHESAAPGHHCRSSHVGRRHAVAHGRRFFHHVDVI
jgi:hypothetical protein